MMLPLLPLHHLFQLVVGLELLSQLPLPHLLRLHLHQSLVNVQRHCMIMM